MNFAAANLNVLVGPNQQAPVAFTFSAKELGQMSTPNTRANVSLHCNEMPPNISFRNTLSGDINVVPLQFSSGNGELDVAIMVSNALTEPQAMVSETLTRSPNRVWMASNHALTAQEEITLADCAGCEQIVLEADRIDELMTGVWARHQLKPRIMLRTSSLEAVRSLVGAGAGIAVLPDILYRPWTLDAEHVDVRRLRDEIPTVDVGLVWRRGSGLKPAAAEFIELAREQSRLRRA
jgi:DNA-binding transcriptional LysR family regulator